MAVPITLVMAGALALPGSALAAEGTSGYGSTPTTPTTTTKTTPTPTTPTTPTATTPAAEPKTGTSPSKEKSTPSETSPESKSTAPEKATSLPFTGLDLRWMIGVGVLLMGAGLSIVVVQRRQRRHGGR